jgi:hypothetical protein
MCFHLNIIIPGARHLPKEVHKMCEVRNYSDNLRNINTPTNSCTQ